MASSQTEWHSSDKQVRRSAFAAILRQAADLAPPLSDRALQEAAEMLSGLLEDCDMAAMTKSFDREKTGVRMSAQGDASGLESFRIRAMFSCLSAWTKKTQKRTRSDQHKCGTVRFRDISPKAASLLEEAQGSEDNTAPRFKLQRRELAQEQEEDSHAPRGSHTHPIWRAVETRHGHVSLEAAIQDGSWRSKVTASVARDIADKWIAPLGVWADYSPQLPPTGWFRGAETPEWATPDIRLCQRDNEDLTTILKANKWQEVSLIRPQQLLFEFREQLNNGVSSKKAADMALKLMEQVDSRAEGKAMKTFLASSCNIPLLCLGKKILRSLCLQEALTLQLIPLDHGAGAHLLAMVEEGTRRPPGPHPRSGAKEATAEWAYSCIMDSIHSETARQAWLNAHAQTLLPKNFTVGSLYAGALCALTAAVVQDQGERATPVLMAELDWMRQEALRRTYPSATIRTLAEEAIQSWEGALPHVLAITAPCDCFSTAQWGSTHMATLVRAETSMRKWIQVVELIAARPVPERPRVIIMENVTGLASHFKSLYDLLNHAVLRAGYHITHARRCPAEHYGMHARRPRLLWACTLARYLR
jgi:hypothetical protein